MTTVPLTTLTVLKDELGIVSDAENSYLERLIQRASARLESLCGVVCFGLEEVAEHVTGHGTSRIVLARTPVVSIASIELDDIVIDSDCYRVEPDTGIVHADGFLWVDTSRRQGVELESVQGTARPAYLVTYSAGYITPKMVEDDDTLTRTLPYDIEEAVLALAVQSYHDRGVDQRVSSEGLLDARVSYRKSSESVPSIVSEVVQTYRRWS